MTAYPFHLQLAGLIIIIIISRHGIPSCRDIARKITEMISEPVISICLSVIIIRERELHDYSHILHKMKERILKAVAFADGLLLVIED